MRRCKNKRGFTLIELLAVILILGVIALIAVPTITSVIEDSKKAAIKSTASNLVDAVEKQCQVEQMKGETITNNYTITNGEISSSLDIKNYPQSGQITVDDECNAEVAINDGTYCAFANGDTSSVTSDITSCTLDNMPIPDTTESCFIFNEMERTITGYDFDNTSCSSDIVIPATINNIPVEHIADMAFFKEDYDYMLALSTTLQDFETDYDSDENNYTYSKIENIINLGLTPITLQPINILSDAVVQLCTTSFSSSNYVQKPIDYVATPDDGYAYCGVFLNNYEVGVDYSVAALSNITGLDLSKATNLVSIGHGAFMNNTIKRVKFSNLPNLTFIGTNAFGNNNIEGTLDLSGLSNLTTLSNYSFAYNAITEVKFPNNLKQIEMGVFINNSIVNIDLPTGLEIIRRSAFALNLIENLEIPNTVQYIAGFVDNAIETLVIPSNVKKVKANAFYENNISSLTLNEGLTSIGEVAFAFNKIPSLSIPNSLKNLGIGAFFENNLSSLIFGSGLSTVGEYAFAIDQDTTTAGQATIDTVVIPDNWTAIPAYLFSNTKINNLTIGKNVQTIGSSAFLYSNIKNITWGERLLRINDNAFYGIQVENLVIPNNVTYIGDAAFRQPSCKTIVIPDSVTTIGQNAFQRQNTDSIKIGSGVTSIGKNAFGCAHQGCHSLIEIDLNEDTKLGPCWSAGYGTTISWKDGGPYKCSERY